jgi:RNA polymerase sigma-70 factor (ECF subfamily)
MPKGERRQREARPALGPDQDREEIPSSGIRPRPATASDGKLAHAVRRAAEFDENASDEMLVKHIAKGDKAAMHIMFARHRVKVFRFIQGIVRNTAIAEDLVSQVFLDVWRSANSFESRSRVSTWLLSIARLKALSSFRARQHANIDRENVIEIVDPADTPDVMLDRKRTNTMLRACIDKLSPAHREIIDLVYYHEKSVAEVSEIVGIPHATAKSRMFYARKQLAGLLVNAGFEGTTARTGVDDPREARAPLNRGQGRRQLLDPALCGLVPLPSPPL